MERNPYYYTVDTDGNQLPYIDNVVMTLAQDIEVVNLRAMAGEYDMQERHIDLQKLPVILDNRDRGNYDVHLDLAYNGADTALHVNIGLQGGSRGRQVAARMPTSAARSSLGIDRDQINETFWLGLATPGSTGARRGDAGEPGHRNGARNGRARYCAAPIRCSTGSG